ncbi:hypothetical protein HL653_09665 [Sphingomonas sp. AP4-R1]|uniref:hypothetical protein n=1 Tax=Sphingomonas sp. AP4-R1 TaxID=2735134 RepID=UPI001493C99C|nr:hypothetical protein [Sphingomonas sp. AP4-R1]QJU58029.1 hypothetical protein HL653_09665 [Sphingomonas sp. AP4-R1]
MAVPAPVPSRLPANDPQSAGTTRAHLRLVAHEAGLTTAERQAVEIGRDDAFRFGWDAGLVGGRAGRRLMAALAGFVGIRGVMPLADDRLEKLRLFAAMMRRDDRRVHDLGEELRAGGLSAAALHEAITLALG